MWGLEMCLYCLTGFCMPGSYSIYAVYWSRCLQLYNVMILLCRVQLDRMFSLVPDCSYLLMQLNWTLNNKGTILLTMCVLILYFSLNHMHAWSILSLSPVSPLPLFPPCPCFSPCPSFSLGQCVSQIHGQWYNVTYLPCYESIVLHWYYRQPMVITCNG